MNSEKKKGRREKSKGNDQRIIILLIITCSLVLSKMAIFETAAHFSNSRQVRNLSWNHSGLCYLFNSNCFSEKREGMANHLAPFFFKQISINSSSRELLMTIKGVGPVMAEAIISQRRISGPFTHPDDLLRIRGVGPKRMAYLANHLSVH